MDLRSEIKRGSSVYHGIFNLLILQGARDWVTDIIPQPGDLDDHHIVPSSWGNEHLKSNGVNAHTILNRTPLTADTNRNVIGSDLPNVYFRKLIDLHGDARVQKTLGSHFISPRALEILLRSPFKPADFEEFVDERQQTLEKKIKALLSSVSAE